MALVDTTVSVSHQDLLNLLSTRFRDITTIDRKLALPGNSDQEIQEFLCDVCSFANASGGDLIYGLKDAAGNDGEAVGIESVDPDTEISHLAELIDTGVNGRIPNVRIQTRQLDKPTIRIASYVTIANCDVTQDQLLESLNFPYTKRNAKHTT